MLTEILTPTHCASCKLCCNFHRSSAWETPALDAELIYLLQEDGVPLEKRADGSTSFYLHFCTDSEDEVANCPMLDTKSGCILPREMRPFECRIWPLRLMRKSGRLIIGLYQGCPSLTNERKKRLVHFATGELLPRMLEHAKRYPHSVREYDEGYSVIWTE